jgi:pimeloyl-ACP methyl ester carboxylesterase
MPLSLPHVEGVTHGYATVDGLRIHYAEAGSGPVLILLHGWPQNWYAWRSLIGPLSADHRVICPDLRGLGWSEGPTDGNYRLRRLGEDIVALMDALDIDRADLVAHDWGGVAGYFACLEHPQRFGRYVALATLHPWLTLKVSPLFFLRPWHFYALSLPAATPWLMRRGMSENRLRAWRHEGSFTPKEIEIYGSTVRSPRSVVATERFYRNFVLREVPRLVLGSGRLHLSVPTLHLSGQFDGITKGLPQRVNADDLTFGVVEKAGHFIAEEQPAQVRDLIVGFLSR